MRIQNYIDRRRNGVSDTAHIDDNISGLAFQFRLKLGLQHSAIRRIEARRLES